MKIKYSDFASQVVNAINAKASASQEGNSLTSLSNAFKRLLLSIQAGVEQTEEVSTDYNAHDDASITLSNGKTVSITSAEWAANVQMQIDGGILTNVNESPMGVDLDPKSPVILDLGNNAKAFIVAWSGKIPGSSAEDGTEVWIKAFDYNGNQIAITDELGNLVNGSFRINGNIINHQSSPQLSLAGQQFTVTIRNENPGLGLDNTIKRTFTFNDDATITPTIAPSSMPSLNPSARPSISPTKSPNGLTTGTPSASPQSGGNNGVSVNILTQDCEAQTLTGTVGEQITATLRECFRYLRDNAEILNQPLTFALGQQVANAAINEAGNLVLNVINGTQQLQITASSSFEGNTTSSAPLNITVTGREVGAPEVPIQIIVPAVLTIPILLLARRAARPIANALSNMFAAVTGRGTAANENAIAASQTPSLADPEAQLGATNTTAQQQGATAATQQRASIEGVNPPRQQSIEQQTAPSTQLEGTRLRNASNASLEEKADYPDDNAGATISFGGRQHTNSIG